MHCHEDLLKFQLRMGNKSDSSDFERGLVVSAGQAGQSVSETADQVGFSHL